MFVFLLITFRSQLCFFYHFFSNNSHCFCYNSRTFILLCLYMYIPKCVLLYHCMYVWMHVHTPALVISFRRCNSSQQQDLWLLRFEIIFVRSIFVLPTHLLIHITIRNVYIHMYMYLIIPSRVFWRPHAWQVHPLEFYLYALIHTHISCKYTGSLLHQSGQEYF